MRQARVTGRAVQLPAVLRLVLHPLDFGDQEGQRTGRVPNRASCQRLAVDLLTDLDATLDALKLRVLLRLNVPSIQVCYT